MKKLRKPMAFERPSDSDILEAYLHKSAGYSRADARRIKRALRKLAFNS
jgi:hypothetical protein